MEDWAYGILALFGVVVAVGVVVIILGGILEYWDWTISQRKK